MCVLGDTEILEKIAQSLAELDSERLQKAVEEALRKGVSPQDIVKEGMSRGMAIVGERYEKGDYFLSELIMAGVTMKEGMALVEPHLKGRMSE
ncbi:MAG: B12-binding domain-containing protein, partial [Candidatus Bathyarchaeia archaeon]